MPILAQRISVAAGTTNPNIFAGFRNEYLAAVSTCTLGIVTDGPNGEATAQFLIGDDVIVDPYPIPVEEVRAGGVGLVGRGVMLDDLKIVGVGLAGQRLLVAVQNTGAAAHVITALLIVL